MATKRRTSLRKRSESIVSYDFQDRTYQIDTVDNKVYRRFVEIETSKACEIISAWRSADATA